MSKKTNDLVIASEDQFSLFHVEKQAEVNGIEMGVLENGVPYLTERGLARMCGIDSAALNRMAANWTEERTKPRGAEIDAMLQQSGYTEPSLYLKSEHNGTEVNAYTESVCLAILEYYAFIAEPAREQATRAYRALARHTFRDFIYSAVGYAPDRRHVDDWQHFHDRIDMTKDKAPAGYFGIFPEIASMIVPMIRNGVMISNKVVPDISVGMAWSGYWDKMGFDDKYGPKKKYDHEYPAYYPQAKSNPQAANAYPNEALGEFRRWLQDEYISKKFPRYLMAQARQKKLTRSTVDKTIEAFTPKAIK